MRRNKIWCCAGLFISFLLCSNISIQGQVRIMPVGNSITYDENSFDVPGDERPVGDRISYRYRLYQLLVQAGYEPETDFDFVGSEDGGNNYFQNDEMDDCAGFPGIEKGQLITLLNTGVNPVTSAHVSPGPYLDYYQADIILLHIGTNNLTDSESEVSEILDIIRSYDSGVWILVARIINRASYSELTTTYNDNVQSMVSARNDPRIKSVNMETGAGINYSTDMTDNLHPNTTGYNKMAAKWFETINNLNTKPVLTSISEQSVNEGSSFAALSLDSYVADAEDADNLISWTFKKAGSSHLSVSIDGNRVLHVSPTDNNWNGSETLRLIAEDSGDRLFKKRDSIDVTFKVLPVNDLPVITSTPVNAVNENASYSYTIQATDIDNATLTYSAPVIPSWLEFNTSTHILSGTPHNENVGISNVTLQVSDGTAHVEQSFQITVNNVNDLPVFTTTPDTVIHANELYTYIFKAADIDLGDVLTYAVIDKPAWLNFTATDTSGILSNTPLEADMGLYPVKVQVSDGTAEVTQQFNLQVIAPSSVLEISKGPVQKIYPVPAHDQLFLKFQKPVKTRIEILDELGNLQLRVENEPKDVVEINISDLHKGIYLCKVIYGNKNTCYKITKGF